jgi:hypothetical protein
MTAKAKKSLVEIIRELSAAMQVAYGKALKSPYDCRDLLAQIRRASTPAESFVAHFQALDALALSLIGVGMYREAARVTGCALKLLNGVHAAPLDGPEVLIVHCYLLAKHSHASSLIGDFVAVMEVDQHLGRALMAVLRSEADFPVRDGGINALVKHLETATCAAKIPLQISFAG